MAGQMCLSKDKKFLVGKKAAGQQTMPRWNAVEVERLRQLYPHMDNLEIARRLNRSVASVANKANQLRLRKDRLLKARIGRRNVAVRYGQDAGSRHLVPL